MHVAASSEALLRHFQDHNDRARAAVDAPPAAQDASCAVEICTAILESCLEDIVLEAEKRCARKRGEEAEADAKRRQICEQVVGELLIGVDHECTQRECASLLCTLVDRVIGTVEVSRPELNTRVRHEPDVVQVVEEIVKEVSLQDEVRHEQDVVQAVEEIVEEVLLRDEVRHEPDVVQTGEEIVEEVLLRDEVRHEPDVVQTVEEIVEEVSLRNEVDALLLTVISHVELQHQRQPAEAEATVKVPTQPPEALQNNAVDPIVDKESHAEVVRTLADLVSSVEAQREQPSKPRSLPFQHKFAATLLWKLFQRKFQLRMLRAVAKLQERKQVITAAPAPAPAPAVTQEEASPRRANTHVDTEVYMEKSQVLDLLVHAGIDPAVLESNVGKKAMPSASMRAQMAQALKAKHEQKTGGSSSSVGGSSRVVLLKDDEQYGTFFKMLKAKVPRPAIELKMKQKGLDPAMLDKDPESPSPNQPKEVDSAVIALKDDEAYGPFFKMLKARVPRPAIELKMKQKGLDPAMLDKDPDAPSPNQPKETPSAVVALKDDEDYGPFFKMLKAKVPRPAIELKMRQKGLDPAMLDKDPESPSPNQQKETTAEVVALKDDEEYGPFFKMLKARVPRPAIELKMRQKGLDPAMLDKDPESPSPNQPMESKAKAIALKDDEDYGPFFKMLKARVPRPAIELKMKLKGLDPSMLDKDPESPSPNQSKKAKAEVIALKDDEEYGPFFKMLKAKVPRAAIELKMKQKGLDPAMLDKDPESPSPYQPKEEQTEAVALKDDEDYGPFFKMLKAKVPRPAIELKMKQKGLDPAMLDKDPESPSPNQPKEIPSAVVALKDDEDYGPFFKMLKAKVPRPAIELKMRQKGLDPAMLDKDPESPSPNQPTEANAEVILLKDDENYGPFFKMLKAKVPRPAIELKMKQKGLDPSMLDKDPESPSPNQPQGGGKRVLLQDDEIYGPFFKMLKAKVPRPAIELKMKQKGLDPAMLDKDPTTTLAPSSVSSGKKAKVKLKDDEAYGPFLKMLSAKVPRMAIELKMRQKGLDPGMLDKDPNSLIDASGSDNSGGGGGLPLGKGKAKMKVKKKKVSIKPVPEKKSPTVMRRKLHWRKVSKFTLEKKETVWKRVGKFSFEEKEVEELSRLFVQKIVPKERKASTLGSKTKAKAKKKSLLDMQRAQNVTIVLSRVKDWFSCPAIQRALCTMSNPKGASIEDVATVLSFLPTEQEEKTLAAFKGDRKTLGLPEQYFLALMDISRFRIKTQILLFKLKFEELYDTIHDDCAFVLAACTDLIESDKFVRLLEVVLALGNVMNESNVDAFTLDSLNGLRAVKSFVGKTSALNYIALVVSTRQRQVLSFINSDIDKYRAASNIAFSNTLAQLRTLENGCKLVDREYKRLSELIDGAKAPEGNVGNVKAEVKRINQKTVPEEDRVFFHSLSSFHEVVSARMDKLLPKAKETEGKIAQMLDYFCMEPNTAPREVFGLVQSFMTQFQEAVRENDAARSKAMKRARQRHLQKRSQQGSPMRRRSKLPRQLRRSLLGEMVWATRPRNSRRRIR